ncbi:hypothetical protein B7494_g7697 [Chlorociboria aeruginascens]|nr:hypothetical protein B7494_g7697 [Chlorociboria aeruginascens]
MKAPFTIGKKRIEDTESWRCNEDPARLDNFYIKFLGRGGDRVLTEDVKWLAITHKSFDQGRRGYNDKLAFFGRRILNLQTSLELLYSSEIQRQASRKSFDDDRVPFTHPALDGLVNLTNVPLSEVLNKSRMAQLAGRMGMREILRWPSDLDQSGIEVVLTTTVYAIIGAIALQRGGDVANAAARERVLKPLGIC